MMGKSRAEIQKSYRERKRAREGQAYLRKETERVKKYYVPTVLLPRSDLKRRRDKIKTCMHNKRRNINIQLGNPPDVDMEIDADPSSSSTDTGPCDSTTSKPQTGSGKPSKLNIQMSFKQAKRKTGSRHLKFARRKISSLETKVKDMKRTQEKLRKKIWRDKNRRDSRIESPEPEKTLTPRSKSKAEIRAEGISPSKHPSLVKKLQFHNCLLDQVKKRVKTSRKRSGQRASLKVLTGKLLTRYRLQTELSKKLKVNRKQIRKASQRVTAKKTRLKKVRTVLKENVVKFMERDDNSACLPGKKDAVKMGKTKHQKRIMNDYVYNLHQKFLSENPDVKVSLSVFSRCRPNYIKVVKFSARRTCLCQRHQNMTLKVKGLTSAGITTVTNPDTLIKQNTDEEILAKIQGNENEKIEYTEWKRVDVEHKGKITKRMQIVKVEKAKENFKEIMQKELFEFRRHNERVKCQYEAVKQLKEKLPENHAICQMDFAENYSCSHADEVQSAYFDKCSVNLHPAVTYTKDKSGNLNHKSTVYVSDTESHTAGTVYAFVKRIVPDIKSTVPDVNTIHYITDSPTSQYRNKHITHIVAHHDQLFDDIKASWTYFEASHGKGPCDGVGGTAKRLADSAVKREATVIQTAEEFYNWGSSLENSQVKYTYVPKSEAQDELSAMNATPIKGTMQVHGVIPLGNKTIAVRDTSCYCNDCFSDGVFHPMCSGWNKHDLNQKQHNKPSSTTVGTNAGDSIAQPTPVAMVKANDKSQSASMKRKLEVQQKLSELSKANKISGTSHGTKRVKRH